MTYPKPLALDEPRRPAVWVCRVHGDLEPTVTVCPECPPADRETP